MRSYGTTEKTKDNEQITRQNSCEKHKSSRLNKQIETDFNSKRAKKQ